MIDSKGTHIYRRSNFYSTSGQKNFDWYLKWPQLCAHFAKFDVPFDSKILNVGCGDSVLSFQMYDHGYKNITNIDISDFAISKMIEQQEKKGTEMACNFPK